MKVNLELKITYMSKDNKDFFQEKKEWSKTKDALLGSYLKPYLAKKLYGHAKYLSS